MNSDVINSIYSYFIERPEVVAVYIFGSYAKGKERRNSDIDLGILLKDKFKSNENEYHRTYLLGLTKRLRMDFHLVSMNNAGEGILSQIFKYGECIVDNVPDDLIRFKMIKYSMIADFSYQKKMMEKGFIENLFRVDR